MKFLISSLAACFAFAMCTASAGELLLVQVPAAIDPAASIPLAIKNECSIDMVVGNYVYSAIGKSGFSAQPVVDAAQAGSNKWVQLTVLGAYGAGGGSWSGQKTVTIRVDLKQGNTVIGSTVLSRSSSGGVFGGFKGTCASLERDAATLGKDAAKWISQLPAASATNQ